MKSILTESGRPRKHRELSQFASVVAVPMGIKMVPSKGKAYFIQSMSCNYGLSYIYNFCNLFLLLRKKKKRERRISLLHVHSILRS